MMKPLFKKKHRGGEEMALPITAMADIFTVILVFLLKSFSSSAVNVNPSPGLTLPVEDAPPASLEALRVEISDSAVLIEDKPVISLKTFQFDKKELAQDGTINSLSQAFEKERKRQLLIAESNSEVQIDARVIVVSDQKTPYSTLKAVLASAAVQGYTDFKLAVMRDQ